MPNGNDDVNHHSKEEQKGGMEGNDGQDKWGAIFAVVFFIPKHVGYLHYLMMIFLDFKWCNKILILMQFPLFNIDFFLVLNVVISDQIRCNFRLKILSLLTIENYNLKKTTFWGCESLKF